MISPAVPITGKINNSNLFYNIAKIMVRINDDQKFIDILKTAGAIKLN